MSILKTYNHQEPHIYVEGVPTDNTNILQKRTFLQ